MNLHQIVSSVINVVNPNQPATLQISTGPTTNADGTITPTYAAPIVVTAQVQELSIRDLQHLDGLNIQGSSRSIYFMGEVDAIIRVSQKGGDLITTYDGNTWLTTSVLERWDDYGNSIGWCKCSVTLQNGS